MNDLTSPEAQVAAEGAAKTGRSRPVTANFEAVYPTWFTRSLRFARRHTVVVLSIVVIATGLPQNLLVTFYEAFQIAGTDEREAMLTGALLLLPGSVAIYRIARCIFRRRVTTPDLKVTYTIDRPTRA